jgi:hypothetical protein
MTRPLQRQSTKISLNSAKTKRTNAGTGGKNAKLNGEKVITCLTRPEIQTQYHTIKNRKKSLLFMPFMKQSRQWGVVTSTLPVMVYRDSGLLTQRRAR